MNQQTTKLTRSPLILLFTFIFLLLTTSAYSAPIPEPIVDYRMDEAEWTGTAGEVKDNSSNNYDGTAVNGANTLDNSTAGGGICRVGDFIGNNYLTPTNPITLPKNNYTITLWVKFPLDTGGHTNYGRLWFPLYKFNLADRRGESLDKDFIFFKKKWIWGSWSWNRFWCLGNANCNDFQISDGWHMLTFVASKQRQGQTKLFIDGQHQNTINNFINSGELTYLFTSDFNNDLSGQTLGSYADEFKIFDKALKQTQIQQIYNNESKGKNWDGTVRNCNQGTNISYYLIEHDGTGLTCQPEKITIRACTDNSTPCTEYTSTTDVTLKYDSKSQNYSFTGNTEADVVRQTPGNVTLYLPSMTPSASNGYQCYNTINSSNSCDISFYDSGFVFDVTDEYSCKPQTVSIQALQTDSQNPEECVPAFANKTIPVDFAHNYVNPASGTIGIVPTIDNTSLDSTIDLRFDSNGEASFDFKYKNAGQIGITASFDNATVQAAGSDNVTLKPVGFNVYTTTPNSQAVSGANSSVFVKAGEKFNITSEAKCWESDSDTDLSDNDNTINYQKDNITLSHSLIEPAGGNPGNIGISSLDFADGIASIDNQTFSEVGIINFELTDNDYLGAGEVTGTSDSIGRFIPDHFDVQVTDNGILEQKISSNFTYIGQTMNYLTQPNLKITAENLDNNTTKNYEGDFAKLTADNLDFIEPDSDNTTTGSNGTFLDITSNIFTGTITAFTDGIATYTFSASDNFTYTREENSKISYFSSDIRIPLDNISDSDGVKGKTPLPVINLGSAKMKYGALDIENNYGPETESLILPIKILYWNNNQWELNTEDSETSKPTISKPSDFKLTNWQDYLEDNETDITYVGDNDSDGNTATYQMNLSKPGEGNQGSVDVILDNNSSLYKYLWDNETTPGTATFGIYRGRDSIIEWKEVPAE